MEAITLGPMVVPMGRLIVLLAVAVALLALRWIPRDERANAEQALWWAGVIGLVTARIAYVLLHFDAFRSEPLSALRIWEDGFVWSVGAAVAVIVAAERAQRRRFRLHRLALPVTAGMLTWGLASTAAQALAPPIEIRLSASAQLKDLSGRSVRPTQFLGRPTVVNLWATWCPPCRREMPVLAAAQSMHPEVNFVFVDQGETPARISAYLRSEGLDLRNVLLDDAGAFREFASAGLPTTLFLDAQGRVQARHMGALSPARLRDYLDALGATPLARSPATRADNGTGGSRLQRPAKI